MFKDVNAEIMLDPDGKYGDFRDWFIIDEEKRKIHKTAINFFVNNILIHEDIMPINTKRIEYIIESKVLSDITINKIKWIIPEMEYEKETIFNNPTLVTSFDTFTIDGAIDFMMTGD